MVPFSQVAGILVKKGICIPKLRRPHERYVRRRWSQWWKQTLTDWAALEPELRGSPEYSFAKLLAAAPLLDRPGKGSPASAKGYAARFKSWAAADSRPTAETVFKVGQIFGVFGLTSVSGIVALY